MFLTGGVILQRCECRAWSSGPGSVTWDHPTQHSVARTQPGGCVSLASSAPHPGEFWGGCHPRVKLLALFCISPSVNFIIGWLERRKFTFSKSFLSLLCSFSVTPFSLTCSQIFNLVTLFILFSQWLNTVLSADWQMGSSWQWTHLSSSQSLTYSLPSFSLIVTDLDMNWSHWPIGDSHVKLGN